jgi:hypothetical protein
MRPSLCPRRNGNNRCASPILSCFLPPLVRVDTLIITHCHLGKDPIRNHHRYKTCDVHDLYITQKKTFVRVV